MSAAHGPRTSIAVSENSCVSCVLESFIAADRCGFIRPRSESLRVRIPEYRTIAAGDGPLAASAFVAASELLATRPGTSSD